MDAAISVSLFNSCHKYSTISQPIFWLGLRENMYALELNKEIQTYIKELIKTWLKYSRAI